MTQQLSPATPSLAAKKVLTAALESWLDLNADEDGIAAPIAAALRAAALACKRDSIILLSLADELENND